MRFRLVLVTVTLMAVCGWWTQALAQGVPMSGTIVPGDSAILTVDALPLQAEVRLDGVPLGTAHDLIARVLPVVPGDHVVQISAEGHLTSLVQVPGISNWATRVQVQLVPDRRP